MSWHFSQALVEEYLERSSSGGELSAPSRSTATVGASSCSGKTKDFLNRSPSGTMCEPSTGYNGADVLMWYLEGFPAKRIQGRLREKTMLRISGRKCDGSWQMSLLDSYSPKTSHAKQSTERRMNLSRWVTKRGRSNLERTNWVQTTLAPDTGFVHTPTVTANYSCQSMQKWPNCRNFVRVFGKPSPTNHEWLMGWPIGWSALQPLETDKFLSWWRQHGKF